MVLLFPIYSLAVFLLSFFFEIILNISFLLLLYSLLRFSILILSFSNTSRIYSYANFFIVYLLLFFFFFFFFSVGSKAWLRLPICINRPICYYLYYLSTIHIYLLYIFCICFGLTIIIFVYIN